MLDEAVHIERVDARATRPLRQAVLRPHQRVEELVYPGDDAPDTEHFGAFYGARLVGIASIFHEPPRARGDDPRAWRLRAMAVDPSLRGRGVGALLLKRCVDAARARSASLLWCDARVAVISFFYERAGFAADGEIYGLPNAGNHRYMSLMLD